MSLPTFVNNPRSTRVKAGDESLISDAPARRRNARLSDVTDKVSDLHVGDESGQQRGRNDRRRSIGDVQHQGPKGKKWTGPRNGHMGSVPEISLIPEPSSRSESCLRPSQARGAKTSVPELPALSGNKSSYNSKGASRRPGPQPAVVKIGMFNHSVPISDLRYLFQQFDALDEKSVGVVSWVKLQDMMNSGDSSTKKVPPKNVFSSKTMETKAGQLVRKRASMATRISDGNFSFEDVLRIKYPNANGDDILVLAEAARVASGVRLNTTTYPKVRRQNAANQFATICDMNGKLYIDEFEDYLIQRWPDTNQYELMKLVDPKVMDRLNEDEPMTGEEFMWFFLRLEDIEISDDPRRAGQDKKAAELARRKLEKSKQKPQEIFGSYISSRDTAAAERALMR